MKSLDYLKILGEVENYFDRKTVNIFLFERFCENPQLVLNNMLDIIGVKHVNIDFSRTENVSLSNFSYIILKVVNRILWVDHNSVKIIPSYPFADKIHRDKNALHRLLAFLSSLVTPRYILVDCIDKFFKLPKARPFSNKLMLQILNEHKESNAELDEKYSLGLKEYGYY